MSPINSWITIFWLALFLTVARGCDTGLLEDADHVSNCSGIVNSGVHCQVLCAPGYNGNPTIASCSENGAWVYENDNNLCQPITCSLESINSFSAQSVDCFESEMSFGTTCIVACTPSYTGVVLAPVIRQCVSMNTWTEVSPPCCVENCVACQNSSICIEPADGWKLNEGVPVESCVVGFTGNLCIQTDCPPHCVQCVDSSTCSSPEQGYVLFLGQVLGICPLGTVTSVDSKCLITPNGVDETSPETTIKLSMTFPNLSPFWYLYSNEKQDIFQFLFRWDLSTFFDVDVSEPNIMFESSESDEVLGFEITVWGPNEEITLKYLAIFKCCFEEMEFANLDWFLPLSARVNDAAVFPTDLSFEALFQPPAVEPDYLGTIFLLLMVLIGILLCSLISLSFYIYHWRIAYVKKMREPLLDEPVEKTARPTSMATSTSTLERNKSFSYIAPKSGKKESTFRVSENLPPMLCINFDQLRFEHRISADKLSRIFSVLVKDDELADRFGSEIISGKRYLFSPDYSDVDILEMFQHEIQIMQLLINQPKVIQLLGYVENPNPTILLPLMDTDLSVLMSGIGFMELNIELAVSIAFDISAALSTIHSANIVFNNLQPKLVLIQFEPFCALLSGFEHSKSSSQTKPQNQIENTLPVRYLAPECFETESSYPSDIYAFGIVLLEILSGEKTWADFTDEEVKQLVLKGSRPQCDFSLIENDTDYSDEWVNIIETCLMTNQSKRPTPKKMAARFAQLQN
eukprot:Lithocolla_globosa_v1_NODE_1619_length_2443_cov_22.448911.p1 type:complete len:745 gc:universal NODE_1619_length_2443_cov_22.448911:161-2395(+)